MKEYELGALIKPLCAWYRENKRSMPWREDATPYHVWLSEIMLQQTRIEAVKSYYARFTERLPDIEVLANVSEEELLKLWEGLGYYNRVRNLQKTAKILVERYEGRLPADYDLLLELPGIGNYTAGAIASIAYGIPAPAVDGNVLRVTMRYLNCEDDITKISVRRRMEKAIMNVIPKKEPGLFNEALMELGEVICIPNGKPMCEKCPLVDLCQAHEAGREEQLPVKPDKKTRRMENKTIFVMEYEGRIAIQKRPNRGLLAGLWEFPSEAEHFSAKEVEKKMAEWGMQIETVKKLGENKHIFSHVEWDMKGYLVSLTKNSVPYSAFNWVKREELERVYAIPVAFHPFLHQI